MSILKELDSLYDEHEFIDFCELFLSTYKKVSPKSKVKLLELSYTRWFNAEVSMYLVDNL